MPWIRNIRRSRHKRTGSAAVAVISAQVLQEFYVTVVRKAKVPMAPAKALEWIEALEAFP